MNKKKNSRESREDKWFINKPIPIFTISKFTSFLKDSLPYSRIRVTNESLLLNIVLSISLILFRRVDRSA